MRLLDKLGAALGYGVLPLRGKIDRCVGGHCLFDRQTKERRGSRAQHVKIWYDAEADFLEVLFSEGAGYMRETSNDAIMERVDENGNLLGFTVMQVSRLAKD